MPGPPSTQAPAAPKGQQYGQQGAQLQAQEIVPVAGSPTGEPGRPRSSSGPSAQPQPGLEPGNVPTLDDPSAYPDQPITAGLPTGPGPGPEALNMANFGAPELAELKAMFMKYPNEDLRAVIDYAERTGGYGNGQLPVQ